uniref:PH domain-containing protein n=1 Tax=Bursaphelenchus xylophilus TaxID=6326 RepID=A0A1I7RZN2_BURXY
MLDCEIRIQSTVTIIHSFFQKGKRIQSLANEIIHSNDPTILYTAYIQRVVLMKNTDVDWGVEFKSTANGIHLVTKVRTGNGNNLAAKIHVGDEIVEINRQSVVGWKTKNIRRKWDSSVKATPQGGFEIEITLAKRPRESWIPITLQKGSRSNVAPEPDQAGTETERSIRDFKRKIQPDLFVRHEEAGKPRRIRSASFCSVTDHQFIFTYPEEDELYRSPSPSGPTKSPTALILTEKRPIFRRASVWTESPPAVLRSPFDRLRYTEESNAWLLLLASWAETIPKKGVRAPYRSLIINGETIEEEDEEVEEPFGKKSRNLPLAEPDEISDLDEERLENAAKKSASMSAIQKSLSSDNVAIIHHPSLESLAKTPIDRVLGNLAEGWTRRKVVGIESKSTDKWIKCWVMMTQTHLFVYSDQKAKIADIVFDLKACSLSLIPKLKTSKKHVFSIRWPQGEVVFAPFSQSDFTFWIQGLSTKTQCEELGQTTLPRREKDAVYIRDQQADADSADELDSNASNQGSPASKVSLLFPSRLFSRLSRRGRLSYRTPANSAAAGLTSD